VAFAQKLQQGKDAAKAAQEAKRNAKVQAGSFFCAAKVQAHS
jgi:hypothetical protein